MLRFLLAFQQAREWWTEEKLKNAKTVEVDVPTEEGRLWGSWSGLRKGLAMREGFTFGATSADKGLAAAACCRVIRVTFAEGRPAPDLRPEGR